MNELIKIEEKEGERVVNARDLHQFLEVGKDYSTWIKDRINKHDFVENQDFIVFPESGENLQGGRPRIGYAISIDIAKELSMVENNDIRGLLKQGVQESNFGLKLRANKLYS